MREAMTQGLQLAEISLSVNEEPYLTNLSLSFEPGSFTTLLGRTRAGKTSLLRVLAGLERPSAGRLSWDGRDVTGTDVRQRDVAMVYQQFVNYPSLTVYDNIASPLRVKKHVPRAEIDRRVREAAALLRIEPLLDRLPAELSGGQQQRTAIARALVKGAGLLLLDEPLANLDYKLREELRSELRALFRATSAVVVYATAEPSEALLLGGRTAVLDEGRLLQCGHALEVYRAPAHARVGLVFSDPQMNVLEAELTADGQLMLGEALRFSQPRALSALPRGRYQLGVRANHVRLARRDEHDLCFHALVSAQELSGSETLLHVRVGALALAAQMPGVHRFGRDQALELFVSLGDVFMFDATGARVWPLGAEAASGSDAARPPMESHGAH